MPLWLHQTFAWLFIALSTGLAARYGLKGADTFVDGLLVAVVFGAIAAFASFGHGLAARTWLDGHRVWGVVIGLIAVLALIVTLSNSLGAIAGRADASIAERAKASDSTKNDRAELARIGRQRATLPAFRPIGTINADIESSRASPRYKASNGCAPDAIIGRTVRDHCAAHRKLEGELAAATEAARLDQKAAEIRARLDRAPPVQSANPQAEALSRLLGLTPEDVAAWHYFAIALVLELCVMGTFVTLELRRDRAPIEPPQEKAIEGKVAAPAGAIAEPADALPLAPNTRGTPEPTASVLDFMYACLPRAEGEKVEWTAIYAAYRRWCAERQPAAAALPPASFGERLDELCGELGIRTRATGRGKARSIYCLDVRLAG